jgi:basic membrane protein A
MTKQVDVAVFETVRALRDGAFEGGVRTFGLLEKGVDYVYDEHNRRFIPEEVRAQVEALRARIMAGEIKAPNERP